MQSQVRWHGYDPDTTIVTVTPREGETVWRTEDIVRTIEDQGDSIALVWLSGLGELRAHVLLFYVDYYYRGALWHWTLV